MTLQLPAPILYLITRGVTTKASTSTSAEFRNVLAQISAAVSTGIQLIQLREKNLAAGELFKLTERAVKIASGSSTRVLVNDRADIAAAAGAAGVHLTTRSLPANVIRRTFGREFLIGVSTHSDVEAQAAYNDGADFVVLGPIFPTASKEKFGQPLSIAELAQVTNALPALPVLALGGISLTNAKECLRAGASGIAAISLFSDPELLESRTRVLRQAALEATEVKHEKA